MKNNNESGIIGCLEVKIGVLEVKIGGAGADYMVQWDTGGGLLMASWYNRQKCLLSRSVVKSTQVWIFLVLSWYNTYYFGL